uniref:Uncharacterized protein n=1 Tax=Rhizophora mucronata TaxID=61149 RepID=A0A2P2PCY5_RHIMU
MPIIPNVPGLRHATANNPFLFLSLLTTKRID